DAVGGRGVHEHLVGEFGPRDPVKHLDRVILGGGHTHLFLVEGHGVEFFLRHAAPPETDDRNVRFSVGDVGPRVVRGGASASPTGDAVVEASEPLVRVDARTKDDAEVSRGELSHGIILSRGPWVLKVTLSGGGVSEHLALGWVTEK